MLVACNPYARVAGLYSRDQFSHYSNLIDSQFDPHIFAIPAGAFRSMEQQGLSQSILISGESGAGKSESTKLCLQFLCQKVAGAVEGGVDSDGAGSLGLGGGGSFARGSMLMAGIAPTAAGARMSRLSLAGGGGGPAGAARRTNNPRLTNNLPRASSRGSRGSQEDTTGDFNTAQNLSNTSQRLNNQILASNTILEAFGNSRTKRNLNSSRFGKWIQLFFAQQDGMTVLVGASVRQFLFERIRVSRQTGELERNFHVFGYLFLGGGYLGRGGGRVGSGRLSVVVGAGSIWAVYGVWCPVRRWTVSKHHVVL